jgi:hypothetical protein
VLKSKIGVRKENKKACFMCVFVCVYLFGESEETSKLQ